MGAGPKDDKANDQVGQGLHNANFLVRYNGLSRRGTGRHAKGQQGGSDVLEQFFHGTQQTQKGDDSAVFITSRKCEKDISVSRFVGASVTVRVWGEYSRYVRAGFGSRNDKGRAHMEPARFGI